MAASGNPGNSCQSRNRMMILFVVVRMICVISADTKTTVSIGILFDVESIGHYGTLFANLADMNHHDPDVNLRPVIATVDIADSFAVSNAMCDLISQDVITIIGITNSSSLSTIQSYSNTFNIPFISIGSTHNFTLASPFQIYLRPAYMGGVVDLLDYYQYSKALYIYDTDEGLMRLQDVFQFFNTRELLVDLDVRRITEVHQVTELIQGSRGETDSQIIVIVLDIQTLDINNIVTNLKKNLNSETRIHLITVGLDHLVLNSMEADGVVLDKELNITGFQLLPPGRKHPEKLFPDTFTGDILSSFDALIVDAIKLVRLAVEVAQEEEWFSRLWSAYPPAFNKATIKCSNFIADKKPYGSLFMECLTRVSFYGKTGPVVLDDLYKRRKYLLGVYQYRNGNRALKLGVWSPENGLRMSTQVEDRTYTLIVNASKYNNIRPPLLVYRK